MNNLRPAAVTACHLLIIALLGALVYSNTLTASFQFDDKLNIVDNPFIRDLGNLWPPSGARWFGQLTFALNYRFGGFNLSGYHLVNICIHLLTALSVYQFVFLTLRTPFFRSCRETVVPAGWIAFSCAVLFVVHPIQTQAVTYIVQRFASLAALLFMLSTNFYILARQTAQEPKEAPSRSASRKQAVRMLLFGASAFFAVLSMKTKENTVVLPMVILLYELMFFGGITHFTAVVRQRWLSALSLAAVFMGAVIYVAVRHGSNLSGKLTATNEISRLDYLMTQFRVIVTYIRLLFLPTGQSIDHHYRVSHWFLEPAVLGSLGLILLLACLAVRLYRISRSNHPGLRLASFGILWFFVTLSVESSIIPIADVMFEHRLYLPSVGAILSVVAGLATLLSRMKYPAGRIRKWSAAALMVIVLLLSCAAYLRNRVWQNELTLWSDVIAKTPRNPRGYNMVGGYYREHFRVFDAIAYFRKALEVDNSYAGARSNLGSAYLQIGNIDEGLQELLQTEKSNSFDEIDTGILHYNIAKAYKMKGMPEMAEERLKIALTLIPNEASVYALLGELSKSGNQPEKAEEYFKKAHELSPHKY